MLEIVFKYKDDMSRGEWREQKCVVSSLRQCIDIYGLGSDCEYQIISITDLDKTNRKED